MKINGVDKHPEKKHKKKRVQPNQQCQQQVVVQLEPVCSNKSTIDSWHEYIDLDLGWFLDGSRMAP